MPTIKTQRVHKKSIYFVEDSYKKFDIYTYENSKGVEYNIWVPKGHTVSPLNGDINTGVSSSFDTKKRWSAYRQAERLRKCGGKPIIIKCWTDKRGYEHIRKWHPWILDY